MQEVKFKFEEAETTNNEDIVTKDNVPEQEALTDNGNEMDQSEQGEGAEKEDVNTKSKPSDETKGDVPSDGISVDTNDIPSEESSEQEIDDERVLAFLRDRGFQGESLEDLINPLPSQKREYDEETEKFLRYQEETGRGLKDWNELNKDLSKLSLVDLAKDRVRQENQGVELTEDEIISLLEDELGFDPMDTELDAKDSVRLKTYAGKRLRELQEEQRKYNEPIEGYTAKPKGSGTPDDGVEKVRLTNGMEVEAESYAKQREKYLSERDSALENLVEEKFTLSFEGKDGKKEQIFNYKYSADDIAKARSLTEDVGSILYNYQNEDGSFDHKSFNQAVLWLDEGFRQKTISALMNKARSEALAEVNAKRRNYNFDAPQEPGKPKDNDGYSEIGGGEDAGFGVKYTMPN